jgi:hypothetical protein
MPLSREWTDPNTVSCRLSCRLSCSLSVFYFLFLSSARFRPPPVILALACRISSKQSHASLLRISVPFFLTFALRESILRLCGMHRAVLVSYYPHLTRKSTRAIGPTLETSCRTGHGDATFNALVCLPLSLTPRLYSHLSQAQQTSHHALPGHIAFTMAGYGGLQTQAYKNEAERVRKGHVKLRSHGDAGPQGLKADGWQSTRCLMVHLFPSICRHLSTFFSPFRLMLSAFLFRLFLLAALIVTSHFDRHSILEPAIASPRIPIFSSPPLS